MTEQKQKNYEHALFSQKNLAGTYKHLCEMHASSEFP